MKTECKILTYNLEKTSVREIESDIAKYCNDAFFSERSIKALSTTSQGETGNVYIANVIYEYRVKWLKILVFIITLFLLAILGIYIFRTIAITALA